MQICGEGLLLEALLDARRVHPSQPLSIVYHVESLLARMRECGGHFTVAFFSSYAALWQLVYDDGSAGSARAVRLNRSDVRNGARRGERSASVPIVHAPGGACRTTLRVSIDRSRSPPVGNEQLSNSHCRSNGGAPYARAEGAPH